MVSNINVKIARGQIKASGRTQCDVAAAGGVVHERIIAFGCVAVASCVAIERVNTSGRVATGRIAKERPSSRVKARRWCSFSWHTRFAGNRTDLSSRFAATNSRRFHF